MTGELLIFLFCFNSFIFCYNDKSDGYKIIWKTRPPLIYRLNSTTSTPIHSTITNIPITSSKPIYRLKKAARQGLRSSLNGVAPEQRRRQLRAIGKKQSTVKRVSRDESTRLHKTYRKVNITVNPPADDLMDVNEKAGLKDYLYQGDINLNEQQLNSLASDEHRHKRQVYTFSTSWPDKTIFYYFDSSLSLSTQQCVRLAVDYLESKTCIKFVESSTAANRVRIFNGVGCYSNIGMQYGEQTLSLGSGCDHMGIAAHELSHALGFIHTQMRHDRDDFVTIDLTDVPQSSANNFEKFDASKNLNLVGYEYGSVMHYSAKSFVSSTGRDSIISKDPKMMYTMGGRIITFQDIRALNMHYSCSCSSELPCRNSGYPNPSNCSQCICPYGFGGAFCDQKANYTCGAILNASTEWKEETYTFGDSTNKVAARKEYTFCNHWITAPQGKTIQLRIDSSYNTQCGYGCQFNGIEPRLSADVTQTQARYCCDEFHGEILNSSVNPLPVITYNRYYITTYTFSYRYVNSKVEEKCEDLNDLSTCQALKATTTCSIHTRSQLKVMCAKTFGLCGSSATTPCSDNFSEDECRLYVSNDRCSLDHPLIAEYSCAKSCGFCDKPV